MYVLHHEGIGVTATQGEAWQPSTADDRLTT